MAALHQFFFSSNFGVRTLAPLCAYRSIPFSSYRILSLTGFWMVFLWVVLSCFCKSYNIYDGLLFFIVMFAFNCDACDLDWIQKMFFFCVLHTANTLTYSEFPFLYKKIYIWSFENVFSHGFLKHNKKIIFLHFWILQHVCKTPKGIGQYSKKYKNLILGKFIYYSPLMFG